jgi:1,4-dihydroxy-2-naphthoyl-CoA hydrolase
MNKKIWLVPISIEEIHLRNQNTLSDHLGIEFTEIGNDSLSAQMPVDARTLQSMGILHGGASCALAETVGSVAANYCVDSNRYCVGLDININHIRAAKQGMVIAIARPFHLGRGTQVWEIRLENEGKLIAIARLTMSILTKK